MRAALLLFVILLVAGCASPEPSSTATPTPATTATPARATATPATAAATPASATATPTSAAAPSSPSPPGPELHLGVVLDVTHSFAEGKRVVETFNVTGGEQRVVIHVVSAGPPEDKSFTSAVVDFYFPQTTSPFLAELPGQQANDFTIQQQPHRGTWRIVFDGVGKTSAQVQVTLE